MEQRIRDIFPGNFAMNSVCGEIVNQRWQQAKCLEGDCLPPRNRQPLRCYPPAKSELERIEKIFFQCAPVLLCGFKFRRDTVWRSRKKGRWQICAGYEDLTRC